MRDSISWKRYCDLNESLSTQREHQQTRLHSSRMHTARFLTVSPSMHCAGGSALPGGWVYLSGVVCLTEGVCLPGGFALPKGSPCRGSPCQGDLPCQEDGGVPPCNGADSICENITLPQTSFAGGNNSDKCDIIKWFWFCHSNGSLWKFWYF